MIERPWHPHTSCQYKIGKYEINELGVCLNPDIEIVVDDGIFLIKIETCQTADGRWVSGANYACLKFDYCGGGFSAAVDNESFPTQEEATIAALEYIKTKFKGLFEQVCKQAIFERKCKQLTLF